MKTQERPVVGVGVIIIRDNKVLLLKRSVYLGRGKWCFPGGHLEFGESFEQAAKRETLEESGITIKNVQFATTTNDIYNNEEKHYITIFLISEYDHGEARIMEPEKASEMDWFEWKDLPSPLFLPVQTLVDSGFNPF